jgi:hypothetical protein
MPSAIVDRSQIEQLNAYPMIVTCQIVVDAAAPANRPSAQHSGTSAQQPRRPNGARLHHTSRFGRPR